MNFSYCSDTTSSEPEDESHGIDKARWRYHWVRAETLRIFWKGSEYGSPYTLPQLLTELKQWSDTKTSEGPSAITLQHDSSSQKVAGREGPVNPGHQSRAQNRWIRRTSSGLKWIAMMERKMAIMLRHPPTTDQKMGVGNYWQTGEWRGMEGKLQRDKPFSPLIIDDLKGA